MSKTTQLGFRCTPEVAERLKKMAFDQRTTVQALLDDALNRWLEAQGASAVLPVGGLSAHEQKYVSEFLEALRTGDPDLVDSVRQMIRSTVRIARKYHPKSKKRVAS